MTAIPRASATNQYLKEVSRGSETAPATLNWARAEATDGARMTPYKRRFTICLRSVSSRAGEMVRYSRTAARPTSSMLQPARYAEVQIENERDRFTPISIAKPAVRYAGQCRRGAHSITPSRRPFDGQRMVTPAALQLWRFKSSAATSRQASVTAIPANRSGDGSQRLFSFVSVTAIPMARPAIPVETKAAVRLRCLAVRLVSAAPHSANRVCLYPFRAISLFHSTIANPGRRLLVCRRGGVQFAGEVTLAKPDFGVGIVRNAHPDSVHAGGRSTVGFGLGLEAEEVVVMDVVGEVVQAPVEALFAGEVDVLAAGERGQLVRCVLFERLYGHDKQTDGSAAAAVLQIVDDLGFSWSEGDGIDDGVGAAECGDDLGRLGFAAVVAGLADEQDGVAVVVVTGCEQLGRVADGVQGCGVGTIAGRELAERAAHCVGTAGELSKQQGRGFVGVDGNLARGASGEVFDHGAEAVELGELPSGGAAALHYDDQRKANGIGVLIEMDGLGDTVVFDDELLGLEVVDDVALAGLHGGGNQHYVGLGAEGVGLVRCRGGRGRGRLLGSLRCDADNGRQGEQRDGEKGPHRSSLLGGWRRFFGFCAWKKMFCGGSAFLLGVLSFLACFVVVNRGEVVVDCVANVVCWLSLFRRLRVGQLFQLYFWVGPLVSGSASVATAFTRG